MNTGIRWVGNMASMVVHESVCDFANSVSPWNMALFEHLHEALSAGFSECGYCLTDRPAKIAFSAPRIRAIRARQGCLICGTTRAVQMAHVLPRSSGASLTIELCANHHWAYDSGELDRSEMAELRRNCDARHGRGVAGLLSNGHGAVRQPANQESNA